jgi:hypothetical protein
MVHPTPPKGAKFGFPNNHDFSRLIGKIPKSFLTPLGTARFVGLPNGDLMRSAQLPPDSG